MRILVEPSDYAFRNLGDTTLLRAAVSRLAGLWPTAAIQVMTDVPRSALRDAAILEPPVPVPGEFDVELLASRRHTGSTMSWPSPIIEPRALAIEPRMWSSPSNASAAV